MKAVYKPTGMRIKFTKWFMNTNRQWTWDGISVSKYTVKKICNFAIYPKNNQSNS